MRTLVRKFATVNLAAKTSNASAATTINTGNEGEKPLYLESETTKASFRTTFTREEEELSEDSVIRVMSTKAMPLPERQDKLGDRLFQYGFSRCVSALHGPSNSTSIPTAGGETDASKGAPVLTIEKLHAKLSSQVVDPFGLRHKWVSRSVYWRPGLQGQKDRHREMILAYRKALTQRRDDIINAYYL